MAKIKDIAEITFLKKIRNVGMLPKFCLMKKIIQKMPIPELKPQKKGGFTAVGIEGAKTNPKTDYGINKLSDLLELV